MDKQAGWKSRHVPDGMGPGYHEVYNSDVVAIVVPTENVDFVPRLVAVLNATEGIPTEALEGGALQSLVEMFADTIDWLKNTPGMNRYSMTGYQVADMEAALAKLRGDDDA